MAVTWQSDWQQGTVTGQTQPVTLLVDSSSSTLPVPLLDGPCWQLIKSGRAGCSGCGSLPVSDWQQGTGQTQPVTRLVDSSCCTLQPVLLDTAGS